MDDIYKRYILFFIGCIGARSLLAYTAYSQSSNKTITNILAGVAIAISIGFFTIYFTNSRQTGPEVFGDKIWWNNIRPLHGTLYLLFGIGSLLGYKNSWMLLGLDTIIGLISFLLHHFM